MNWSHKNGAIFELRASCATCRWFSHTHSSHKSLWYRCTLAVRARYGRTVDIFSNARVCYDLSRTVFKYIPDDSRLAWHFDRSNSCQKLWSSECQPAGRARGGLGQWLSRGVFGVQGVWKPLNMTIGISKTLLFTIKKLPARAELWPETWSIIIVNIIMCSRNPNSHI